MMMRKQQQQPQEYSCADGFRSYRDPFHHEGLPHLVEVFATEDDSVYLLAWNKGICDPEWGDGAQLFSGHSFDCVLSWNDDDIDNHISQTNNIITVRSDPVPPVNDWDIFTQAIMMIRCPIPTNLQSKLSLLMDETTTRLTVTLKATVDLEFNRTHKIYWKSPSTSEIGAYHNLPVCPREWPDTTSFSNQKKTQTKKKPTRRRTLSMVTQILMEYETFEANDRIRIQIPPLQIITWLEYHLAMIGFEHFYIFDNDPKPHGPLEHLLRPYVQEGLVTYVWYPMQDCVRKRSGDALDGSRMTISQALSSTAAIRRYAHHTKFMGHFDVDELVQLPEGISDLKTLLMAKVPSNVSTLVHPQEWFHECNNNNNSPHADVSILDKVYCVSPDSTPIKSIMRTKDVLAFFVHAPWVKTNYQLVDWELDTMQVDGLKIAHIRKRRARDGLVVAASSSSSMNNKNQQLSTAGRPLIVDSARKASLQETIQKRLDVFHASHDDHRII